MGDIAIAVGDIVVHNIAIAVGDIVVHNIAAIVVGDIAIVVGDIVVHNIAAIVVGDIVVHNCGKCCCVDIVVVIKLWLSVVVDDILVGQSLLFIL